MGTEDPDGSSTESPLLGADPLQAAPSDQTTLCFASCWCCDPDNAVSCFLKKPCGIYGSVTCAGRSLLLVEPDEDESQDHGSKERAPTKSSSSSWETTIREAVTTTTGSMSTILHNVVMLTQKSFYIILDFTMDYLTPGRNPLLWIIINSFVVLYSLALLLLVAFYAEDEGKWALRMANQSYLVYDFSTTIIWVAETILGAATVIDATTAARAKRRKQSGKQHHSAAIIHEEPWKFSLPASILHVIIALFFLLDSFMTLVTWKWRKEDIVVDAMWVVLNLAAYTLVLLETLFHVFMSRRRRQRRDQFVDVLYEETPIALTVHHDPVLAGILPFYQQVVEPHLRL